MSNQLELKARTLAGILAQNRLTKTAEQEITHKAVDTQTDLGAEQQKEIEQNVEGTLASTAAAVNKDSDKVEDIPGAQDLNTTAEAALSDSGTAVVKTASDYRDTLAGILHAMNKQASAKSEQVVTGIETLQKFASLTSNSTERDLMDAKETLQKLASTNPLFVEIKNRIFMEKLAEDITALADAEGIPEEQAADELEAAAAANPEMLAEAEDEAAGEAVAELAGAEEEAMIMQDAVRQMAENASANLGVEVSEDDIITAAEETQALADELGVPPEALIAQAIEEMQGAGVAGDEEAITEEDRANAEMILEEAAKNGVSPEEVIQMASEELGGDADVEGDVSEETEEPKEEATTVEKAASLQKRASTNRAAFVQQLRRTAR